MKNCKYCFSDIHKRASVCPVCHSNVTMSGVMKGFVLTVFPILTALISLGFAFFEKYEKGLVQNTLTATATRLEVIEVQNDVSEDAVKSLNAMLPIQARSIQPDAAGGSPMKTTDQKIQEVEASISKLSKEKSVDKNAIKTLQKKRLELKTGRTIFQGQR